MINMKIKYFVVILTLIMSSAEAAILHICNNTATLRGTLAGSTIQTTNVWSTNGVYDGVFARGDTSTRYTSNNLSGARPPNACSWCTEAYMNSAMSSAIIGNGHLLPNRMTVGPSLQLRQAQYIEILKIGDIHMNTGQVTSPFVLRTMHIPITEIRGCPIQCSVTAESTLDFGTLTSNAINNIKKTIPAQLQCNGDANVHISLTSTTGTGTIQLGKNINGRLTVSDQSGEVGFDYQNRGNSSMPIFPDVTLNTVGTPVPGSYSATAILKYSVQ